MGESRKVDEKTWLHFFFFFSFLGIAKDGVEPRIQISLPFPTSLFVDVQEREIQISMDLRLSARRELHVPGTYGSLWRLGAVGNVE